MRLWLLAPLFVCGAALIGNPVAAQQTPAPVPEAMPFDIPYGASIGIDRAKTIAAAAVAEARRHNWKLVVSVVDANGDLLYLERMDGAQLASITISEGKAREAARYRRSTDTWEQRANGGTPSVLSLPGVIASAGGFPLVASGRIVGAIGCSGGLSSQDAVACKAGADTVK